MNKTSGSSGQDEARVSARNALQSASSESQTAVTRWGDNKRRRKGNEGEGGKKSNVIGSKRGEID